MDKRPRGESTALVTGASSGIGEALARELATRGHELVLVARREERLSRLAEELPVRCHVVQCDLESDAAGLAPRVEKLGVQVDLLFNNAGFGTYGRLQEIDAARDAAQVRVNCEAVVVLTHAFLPGMLSRRRGAIVTVASTAGMQPLPYEAVYSATKAFALTFTEALREELRGSGVRALTVNPGPVPTEWQAEAGMEGRVSVLPSFLTVSAERVATEALDALDRDRRSVVPGAWMKAFMRLNATAPKPLKLRIAERLYRPRE